MAASSSAIRMGRAFVEFFGDTSALGRSIGQVKKGLEALGKFSVKIGAGIGAAGGSFLAPLTAFFTQAAERGRDMDGLAKQFGMTVESISGLAGGFEQAGISFEQFGGILDNLSDKVLNNDELLRQFGLTTGALSKVPIDQQLEQIADAFAKMTNPMQKAQLASQVFGSEWRRLMPYLEQGAEGIRKLKEEGKDLAMDPETARRGTEVMKGLNQIWAQFKHTLLDVGSALLPNMETVKQTVAWLKNAGSSIRVWIGENKEAIKIVALVAVGLTVAGAALTAFGTIALGIAGTIATVTSIVAGLSMAVEVLAAAWPLALGAVAVGMAAYFVSQTELGQKAIGELKTGFGGLVDTAKTTWEGVKAAMAQGDFSKAADVTLQGFKTGWAQVVEFFTLKWNAFKDIFVDGWHDAVGEAQKALVDISAFLGLSMDDWANFGSIVKDIWDVIVQTAADASDKLTKAWSYLKEKFMSVWDGAKDAVKKIFGGIAVAIIIPIREAIQTLLDLGAWAAEKAGAKETAEKLRGALGHTPEELQESIDNAHAAIDAKTKEKKEEGHAARAEDAKAAHDDVLTETKVLKAIVDDIKAKEGSDVFGAGGDFDQIPDRKQVLGMGTSVKGGFVGTAAAQQFGVGDKTDRMIVGLNTISEEQKKTTSAIENAVRDVTSAMRSRP